MSDQKLDGQEVLNIRWAYDDPNPKVRKHVSLCILVSKKQKHSHFQGAVQMRVFVNVRKFTISIRQLNFCP